MPVLLYVLAALFLLAPPALAQVAASVPPPEAHFGFKPGTDRRLADWQELSAYYDRLATASPRVTVDTLGATTRGLPLVMLIVTSPRNQARLGELREVQLRLADPRRIAGPEEADRLARDAPVVVLLTSHIHSTEVGAGQMPANLLYRLASSGDPEVLEILDRVILLAIPSLNPDGTQMVADWYRRYLGTEFEGAEPVELYHEYIGHDNNRDWYALTQVETQLVVEKAHNAWRPVIVHDVHQMGGDGPRMFVPPYVDPFERNVDPLIVTAINQVGSYMAADLSLRGLKGVATATQFDLFTPARAYSHYHGGVRILSETASARLATPVRVSAEEIRPDPRTPLRAPTMNRPLLWDAGEWGLSQIVAYQEAGAMALLRNAARNRDYWVANFLEINTKAVEGWPSWPRYWLIPGRQGDSQGLDAVLRALTLGSVEVRRAEQPFIADGREFVAGTYVIDMRQPYASWAQTLLEPQDYPDLRSYPGGPPIRPYDVTAHTLPLLTGVEALATTEDLEVALTSPIDPVQVTYAAPETISPPGGPRIALYRGSRESIAAGWTRWLFDRHGLTYASLADRDVRRGGLQRDYDVVILQDQPSVQIRNGWRRGQVPDEFTGGIGPAGLEALREFVHQGGRLVAIESATDLVIDLFSLAIDNQTAGLSASDFYIPGSILALEVAEDHPIGRGMPPASSIAWFWRTSRAFQVAQTGVHVVARYGRDDPRLSGWALGSHRIAGRPAILEIPIGRGSVVLFGFQPNYRGHSIATWPLLFNALDW